MAAMAAIGALRGPNNSAFSSSSPSNSNGKANSNYSGLAFSSSSLTGDRIPSMASLPSRRYQRIPIVVSPKNVSDSQNSQTCLDPDASRW